MSLEYSYKDVEWCQSCFNKSDECFCDGNIIIPDSMDDVAKIISVKAYPSVTDSKTEEGRIVVNGQIKLNVLYIGENENSQICTLTASHPFSHVINASNVTDDFISLVNIVSCSLSYTTVNSRRLKTTTLLKFCALSCKNNRIKVLTSSEGAETKTKERTVPALKAMCSKKLVITDTPQLPAGKSAIVKILKQSAKITDKDFKVLNNKVIVKGNISASVLYFTEDNITDATVTIPFTEVVEAEGISPSFNTEVNLYVSDCDINPDTDLSGEYKMLDVNIILCAEIKSFITDTVDTVTDIYIPGGALKTSSVNLSVCNSLGELHEEEFIKESINLPKGMPSIQRVIDTECSITGISSSDDAVTANAEITLIYLSDDSASPVNTYTAKVPFVHKFASKNPFNPRCEVRHTGYALTGDNSLEVRIGADFMAYPHLEQSFSVFTECENEEYIPQKRSSVIIAFVNKDDTLWDIAKKYNISVSHLAGANAMEESASLKAGEKLIIPR